MMYACTYVSSYNNIIAIIVYPYDQARVHGEATPFVGSVMYVIIIQFFY